MRFCMVSSAAIVAITSAGSISWPSAMAGSPSVCGISHGASSSSCSCVLPLALLEVKVTTLLFCVAPIAPHDHAVPDVDDIEVQPYNLRPVEAQVHVPVPGNPGDGPVEILTAPQFHDGGVACADPCADDCQVWSFGDACRSLRHGQFSSSCDTRSRPSARSAL